MTPEPSDIDNYSPSIRRALTPASCGLLLLFSLLASFSASEFFSGESGQNGLEFLTDGANDKSSSPGSEMAARGLWSLSFGAVIASATAVCWVFAGILRTKLWKTSARRLMAYFTAIALLLTLALTILGYKGYIQAYGSIVSIDMLTGIWQRNNLESLGHLTDGLNAIAALVSVIVAAGFCLLHFKIQILDAVAKKELPPSKPSSEGCCRCDQPESMQRAANENLIKIAQHIQSLMDQMLYAGAAALMAGLFEVVATLSWSYAPFDTVADIKVQADLCKALPSNLARGDLPATCSELVQKIDMAVSVDDLRHFTRSTALVFGASFSALLAAMYLPVALAYQRCVEKFDPGTSTDQAAAGPSKETGPSRVQHSMVQRLVNLLAALGPLGLGLLSAVFGL